MWSKFLRKIISQKYGLHSSNMKHQWQLFCQKNAKAEIRGIQRISNTKPGEIVLLGIFRGTESLARNLWNENEKDKICPFSSLCCSSLWKALNYENQFGQAGWVSLGVTWLVSASGGHQLLINARLNADLRYHLLLWLLCNYAREVTSLSVVAKMLLYNVSNISLTSKGRTSYWKLHGYNKNWYHLCPGYHSTMPNQCMSNLLLLFPNPHSWTRYNRWKRGRAAE